MDIVRKEGLRSVTSFQMVVFLLLNLTYLWTTVQYTCCVLAAVTNGSEPPKLIIANCA